jgi:hypothetical protein
MFGVRSILGRWIWKLVARLSNATTPETTAPDIDAFYIYGPGRPHPTVLITCFGIPASDLPAIVAAIEQKLRSFKTRVYLVDTPDFSAFLKIGALFEYFPPIEDRRKYLADAPWAAHLRTRYDLVTAKWRPSVVVSYGTAIEQFLAGTATGL